MYFRHRYTTPDFVAAIDYYYPIGGFDARQQHPGFQLLETIVAKKVKEAADRQPKAWFALVEDVKKEWSAFNVRNLAFRSFPSYQLTILLKKVVTDRIQICTVATLSLSLLVNCFTYYVNEHQTTIKNTGEVKQVYTLTEGQFFSEAIAERLDDLHDLVKIHYPQLHLCRSHYLFYKNVPGRISYAGERWDVGNGVLYDFLFGPEMAGVDYRLKI